MTAEEVGSARAKSKPRAPGADDVPQPEPEGLERLLQYLYRTHGFDFTCYKRGTLSRRLQRRLDDLGMTSFAEYLDYLQVQADEFPILIETILINVTGFFRDPESWAFVREHAIAPIVKANAATKETIRVWSVGCATGEEAFTIAMLFCEEMGVDAFKNRVKIYATDLDDDALATARLASYTPKQVADIPEDLRHKYLEQQGSRWTFRHDLRRSVIFGRHDLSHDAAISRLDLVVCRNTLMYFTTESQARILERLHHALKDGGFLFLGRAEMLLGHGDLFTPIDSRHHLFSKVATESPAARALLSVPHRIQSMPAEEVPEDDSGNLVRLLVEEAAIATVGLDARGTLQVANRRARALFDLTAHEIGKPFQDLELSYRPIELRASIDQARTSGAPVTISGVDAAGPSGIPLRLDVTVIPLSTAGEGVGTAIVFNDVTEFHRIQSDLLRSKQEMETAYEELQSANEELETTNEERQSTIEELETTNEEFQSANEELETMNEELQATNSELQTVNFELRERTRELDRLSTFLETVLGSLHFGIIIVDRKHAIQVWNDQSQEMWGLRADEVKGDDLFSLDIGLPVQEFREAVSAASEGGSPQLVERTVACTNRRGRKISCTVSVMPLRGRDGHETGAIILTREV